MGRWYVVRRRRDMSSHGRENVVVAKEREAAAFEKVAYGPTEQRAAVWGRWVVANARRVGMAEADIQAMRKRMHRWLKVVLAYEKDIRELKDQRDIAWKERHRLVEDMREAREQIRVEIFGED